MKIDDLKDKYQSPLLVLWIAVRLLVGFLLIISAIRMYSSIKLDFEIMLASLLVPKFLVEVIWIVTPWVKLYIGGFLILGIFTRMSALMSIGLHIVAVGILGYIKIAEIKIYSSPCSIVSYGKCDLAFVFNILLVILSAVIYLLNYDKLTFDGWVKKQE